MYIARRALFLAIALRWATVSLCSSPSAVAALILFLESKMFWSLLRVSRLLEATATRPTSVGLPLRTWLLVVQGWF